jgi:hypothetical protein
LNQAPIASYSPPLSPPTPPLPAAGVG